MKAKMASMESEYNRLAAEMAEYNRLAALGYTEKEIQKVMGK